MFGLEKLKEAANSARLRAGQMWREHRERGEAKKAAAALNSEHGHGRFFLLHVPATATVLAAFVEWYWAILFCIEATGALDWNYETAAGTADREAAQAQITAAADNARSTIDTLAASVDATPEQLNVAANDAQQAAQALAAAVSETGITPAYTQAYAELVAAVDAAQPADVAAAAEAARSAVDATATTAATNAPLLNPDIWNFAFSTHWPVFVGLVCATIPIVMLSMVWLPVQFSMRGSGRWRRGSVIAVGVLANILVIVSGTVVMNYNRQDQVREAVVMEQTAAQGRAAIDARLEFAREELRIATTNTNPYLNQAANVGAAEWERSYVAQARATNDPRLPQLERALGAARRADALRADIERLTIERATAAPEAASAANVTDTVGAELNTFAQYVEVWRPPFIAVICTLIGIFGAWWVLALMQGLNPRDVMRSGWADEAHRIEDLREEEPVVPKPMRPAREVVTDAETGEELIKITPKPHWRKAKGKKQKVEFNPEIPPDETGVEHDGGGRVGSVSAAQEDAADLGGVAASVEALSVATHPAEEVAQPQAGGEADEQQADRADDLVVQNDSPSEAPPEPELTEEERAEFAMLAATDEIEGGAPDSAERHAANDGNENLGVLSSEPEEANDAAENAGDDQEADDQVTDQTDLPAEREPEKDPAKLLPAA